MQQNKRSASSYVLSYIITCTDDRAYEDILMTQVPLARIVSQFFSNGNSFQQHGNIQ